MRPEQITSFVQFAKEHMGTSHRQMPIRNLVGEMKQGLKELFRAPAGYEVFWVTVAHQHFGMPQLFPLQPEKDRP